MVNRLFSEKDLLFSKEIDCEIVRQSKILTPVQYFNGLYFKRDDLFLPFNDVPLSGILKGVVSMEKNRLYHWNTNCGNK